LAGPAATARCQSEELVPLADDLAGEFEIVQGAGAPGVVVEDRLAEAGALGELDVAADGGAVDAGVAPGRGFLAGLDGGLTGGLEKGVQIGDDFAGVRRVGVVHAEDDAGDGEARIGGAADEGDGFEELAHALEGEEVGLHGDEDFAGGAEAVEGEEAERGGAVKEDDVETGSFGEAAGDHGLE